MTTVLDRVPVDQINARARNVRFRRVVLTVIAAVLYGAGWVTHKTLAWSLYGIGWAAAKVFGAAWTALTWMGQAVVVGWVDARTGGPRGPA